MDDTLVSLTPEKTMDIVLKAIRELLEYDLAVVLSCEGNHQLRVRKAAGPAANENIEEYTLNLQQRKDIAKILEQKTPYLFKDGEQHVDTYSGIIDFPTDHSCMVAPLYVEEEPLGLMTLDHQSCNMFTPQNVQWVGILSKLIALSLAQSKKTEMLNRERLAVTKERNNLLTHSSKVLNELIGNSEQWIRVKDSISLVSASDTPVMILGETGTGKEVVAKAIHKLSARAGRPFIAVNCSAISPGVAESELFGHEKGSFTGAVSSRKGRFELANGGTLFLDEIGDLPPEIQPKLLRVLQEKKLERIGAESTLDVDVRIIAATHVDLQTAVTDKHFREDLYYRLNVFPITLPPLRDRENDVLILAEHFIKQIKKRTGSKTLALSPETVETLTHSHWPGNVRQLQNIIERASIFSRGGDIKAAHLKTSDLSHRDCCLSATADNQSSAAFPGLDEVIQTHLKKALAVSRGKIYGKGGAAEILGLKPTTLQSKLKKFGIFQKVTKEW